MENIDDFDSFSTMFNALPDPTLVIVFMPFNDSRIPLLPSDVHQCIGADHLLATDVSVVMPCCLGVWFVGVTG